MHVAILSTKRCVERGELGHVTSSSHHNNPHNPNTKHQTPPLNTTPSTPPHYPPNGTRGTF